MSIRSADGIEFSERRSVVIVGAGACGLTAALAAADAGADVLVLERDATPAGSTSMAQGNLCAVGTKLQARHGLADDADAFVADIMAKTEGQADPAAVRVIAEQSGAAVDWLMESHAIPFEMKMNWAGFFGHTRERLHGMPSGRGTELSETLLAATKRAGVDVRTGVLVEHLYADAEGRVHGVGFRAEDGSEARIGCDALVLATCGFGANAGMVAEHIPEMRAAYRYYGHPGNEGHGIRWGMELGGETADMAAFQGYGALADPQNFLVNYAMVMTGGIEVNTLGRRFSNELADISGQSLKVLAQPGGTAFMLFDQRRYDAYENTVEMARSHRENALLRGETVEEIAALIDVPGEALRETIDAVNACAAGEATDPFGRDFTPNAPLVAPFYAVRVTGALFHTQGGLRVDGEARVLRAAGGRLPNLFAGGGAARGISGPGVWGYIPAAGLCMAITLGRLAGRSAALLTQAAQTRDVANAL